MPQETPHAAVGAMDARVSERLAAAAWRTLDHLEAQIAVVEARLTSLREQSKKSGEPRFDEELSRAGAALARALKEVTGEVRQIEKHDKRMTFTPEQRFAELLKYVRMLDSPQLEALGEVVDQLRAGRAA